MDKRVYLTTDEVAQELGISKSYAYKVVRQLNAELKAKGYMTITGKVNKKYFQEKLCYGGVDKEED